MNVPIGPFELIVSAALLGFLAAYVATRAPWAFVHRIASAIAFGALIGLTIAVVVVSVNASYPPG